MDPHARSEGAGARWTRARRVGLSALWRLAIFAVAVDAVVRRHGLLYWAGFTVLVLSVLCAPGRATSWWRYLKTGSSSEPGLLPQLQGGDWVVHLDSPGDRPIAVIKAVRDITGMELLPAKQLVDNAPIPVATGLSEEGARRAAVMLGAAGAVASIEQAPADERPA